MTNVGSNPIGSFSWKRSSRNRLNNGARQSFTAIRRDRGFTPPGSRSCPAHNKKPGARPGSWLAIARRSVLRNRRAAEMVVHADANDVVVEADLRRRRDSSHTAALKGCRLNVVCEVPGRV